MNGDASRELAEFGTLDEWRRRRQDERLWRRLLGDASTADAVVMLLSQECRRELVILLRAAGWGAQRIARELYITPGSVRSVLSRARVGTDTDDEPGWHS